MTSPTGNNSSTLAKLLKAIHPYILTTPKLLSDVLHDNLGDEVLDAASEHNLPVELAALLILVEDQFTEAQTSPYLTVISVERGESSGSKSPKWTMELDNGERLWVFQHQDPVRNNFPLFSEAGWGDWLQGLVLHKGQTPPLPLELKAVKDSSGYYRVSEVKPVEPTALTVAMTDDKEAKQRAEDRKKAVDQAHEWITRPMGDHLPRVLILDTETTGLGDEDEVVSISLIHAMTSEVLLNTFVKPHSAVVSDGAFKVNGITADMLANAPSILDVNVGADTLLEYLAGADAVICWNVDFDRRLLKQSYAKRGVELPVTQWECAMQLYAAYNGKWDAKKNNYQWVSLENAMKAFNITGEPAHTARGDVLNVRAVLNHMDFEYLPF